MFNFDAAYDRLERKAKVFQRLKEQEDEDPIVKDGEVVRRSMLFMDSLQRSVAANRPGFVSLDDDDATQRVESYQRYEDRLTSRWKGHDQAEDPPALPANVSIYDAYDRRISERWKA